MYISSTSEFLRLIQLFHDGSPYHIETSPLICNANQSTGFCMIRSSVMKELKSCLQIIATQAQFLITNSFVTEAVII